jgi:hypothetical protein
MSFCKYPVDGVSENMVLFLSMGFGGGNRANRPGAFAASQKPSGTPLAPSVQRKVVSKRISVLLLAGLLLASEPVVTMWEKTGLLRNYSLQ